MTARNLPKGQPLRDLCDADLQWITLPEGALQPEQLLAENVTCYSANSLAQAWGCQNAKVVEAIAIGFVPGFTLERHGRKFWFGVPRDPSRDLLDLLDKLERLEPRIPDAAAMRRYDRLRILGDSAARYVPDFAVREYLRLPDRYEGDTLPRELHGVFTISTEQAARLSVNCDLIETGMVRATCAAAYEGDGRSALLGALGPNTPILRHTWLDPAGGNSLDPIPAVSITRLLSISGPHQPVATAHLARVVATQSRENPNQAALDHLRMSVVLEGVGWRDTAAMAERIRAFIAGELLPGTLPAAIVKAIYTFRACRKDFERWAAEPVPARLKSWLKLHRPAFPEDPAFIGELNNFVALVFGAGLDGRKEFSGPIRDAFDEHLAEADANLDEAKLLHEGVEEGHAAAGERPVHRFSFPAPIRDENGIDTGATMLVVMDSIRVDHLLETLWEAARQKGERLTKLSFVAAHSEGGSRFDLVAPGKRVAIYRGVEALDPSGPAASPPYMMASYEVGVTVPPSLLPTDVLIRRRAYLAGRNLPALCNHPAALGGGIDPIERGLMAWTLRLTGDVVYPAQSFLLAASTGHFSYIAAAGNPARSGTMIQMIFDRKRGWSFIDGNKAWPCFIATPKCRNEPIKFMVGKSVPGKMREHVDTIRKIGGGFGVVPPSGDHPKKAQADNYVFQAFGRALTTNYVNWCRSLLFGRRMLSQDERDGGAGKLADEGATAKEVSQILVNSPPVAKRYMSSRKAGGIQRQKNFIDLRDDMAALLSDRKGTRG